MIKVFEIWTPTFRANKAVLELNASYYGDLESFKLASNAITFAPGVGLPGRVWASKRPILVPDLADPRNFVRAEAALAAGLTTGLGIPLLDGETVRAVVTLLCTDGVLEIWSPTAVGTALELRAGSYRGAEAFGVASQAITFASGEGLPGSVWANGAPVILPDLAMAATFARKEAAIAAGLVAGFDIAVFQGTTLVDVVILLSPQTLALSKVFEIWLPDTRPLVAELRRDYDDILEEWRLVNSVTSFTQVESSPGQNWPAQALMILQGLADPAAFMRTEAAVRAGLVAGLEIPMLADGKGKATVIRLS